MAPFSLLARLLAANLLLGGVSCAPAPEPARTIDRVVRRLGPSDFPGVPRPRHGPVTAIGDEARSVVAAPREVLVAELLSRRPEGDLVRADFDLDPAFANLPDSAFRLTEQELPFTTELEPHVMAKVARENFSLRRTDGWRLRRVPGQSRVTLELDHEGNPDVQINLRLTALRPAPSPLESLSFDVPDDARIELGFGIAGAKTESPGTTTFQAALRCRGQETQVLLTESLTPAERGWHDRSIVLEGPGTECRLHLETRSESEAAPGAVWTVPRILAPSVTGNSTNLVLISLDTLRGDHLSAHGYPRSTTPVLDTELVAKGTTFTNAVSTFPQTDVSHLSLFTGLYPAAQPVRGRVAVDDRLELLAERLQAAGFETAAFTEDALVSGAFGFWYGFDQFTERHFAHADRGDPTFEDGIRYLESHRSRRFFLFLHTYKTHDPFVPGPDVQSLWDDEAAWAEGGPAPETPEKHRDLVDRYDRTIREADALVGRLLRALDRLGLTDRTLVVVTSDHGEAFGEHGIAGHGFTPHREALSVPLVFRGPGVPAGLRVSTPVSIADLTPTILDLLGQDPSPQAQGISLGPGFQGTTIPDRALFFSWLRPDASGVRRATRTYHRSADGAESFDLATDPGQRRPARGRDARSDRLLDEHATSSARLREALGPPPTSDAGRLRTAPAIDPDLERSLEALGYLE